MSGALVLFESDNQIDAAGYVACQGRYCQRELENQVKF